MLRRAASGGRWVNKFSFAHSCASTLCSAARRTARETRPRKGKKATRAPRAFCPRSGRASASLCLPQIVNRNLIGRFTVFVANSSASPERSFRVFLPHARAGGRAVSRARHAVYAAARLPPPVVCQPLNTGHPRSSPIFSPTPHGR